MNREQKAAAIAQIAEQIEQSEAVFAVDYRGISVAQAAELRTKLRESDTAFRVVKNTLTERAVDVVDGPGGDALKAILAGPTALAFVRGDAATAAKTIADYARTSQLLAFKGGLMDGQGLSPEQVTAISKLPPRDVLYGMLVNVVAAPLTGLVRSLDGLISGLARQLGQILELKEAGAPAPAAAVQPEAAAEPDATTEPDAAPVDAPPTSETADNQED